MIALILLIGVTAVYGQHGGHHGHVHSCVHNNHQQLKEAQVVAQVVADMDNDQDGLAEVAEITGEFLTKYDHDGSGRINEGEFVKQWHDTYHDAHDFASYLFHHFDQNDDLYLTADDIPLLAKTIDTDGNGETSNAEFNAYLTKLYTECVQYHRR